MFETVSGQAQAKNSLGLGSKTQMSARVTDELIIALDWRTHKLRIALKLFQDTY